MMCNSYKSFFVVLADDCRLNIINLLSKSPMTVNQLANLLKFEQSRVSHALKSLRENGFVIQKIKGKQREYSLEPKIIIPMLKLIDQHVNTYHKLKCSCGGVKWRDM